MSHCGHQDIIAIAIELEDAVRLNHLMSGNN